MKSIIGNHTMKFLAGLILTLSVALAHPTGVDLRKFRIANGRPASNTQFPFQVALMTKRVTQHNQTYSELCSGSLITANVILTAAHCVNNGISAHVFAGAANLSDARQIEVRKEDWLIHDDYRGNDHDIALIFLNESLPLGGNIDIVNLPRRSQQNESFENEYALISGWGNLGDGKHYSQQLQYAYRLILPNATCETSIGDYFHSDLQICVDGSNGISVCGGDSGGPLTVWENDSRKKNNVERSRIIVGISSYATFLCERGHPTVYTRVIPHLDWIHEKAGVPIRE